LTVHEPSERERLANADAARRRTGSRTRDRATMTDDAMDVDAREDESAFDALDDGLEWSLGFLERIEDEDEKRRVLSRHAFPSKAGGAPAWMDPVRVPFDEELRTGRGDTMDFLLQVYAPVDEETSAFHRTVYVFVSADGSKTHEAGGCRAFRGQLPRTNVYYGEEPLRDGEVGRELSAEEEAQRMGRCDRWDVTVSEAAAALRPPTKTFGEFELVVETEERTSPDDTEGMKYVNGNVGDDMTEEDLDEIEAQAVDKDMEQLATFHVMLKSDPEQVLRYCPDDRAKPLWPSVTHAPRTDNVPCCPRCGAARKFEFQILPTIISQLGVDVESDFALDFGSIAVYTCSKACPPTSCDENSRKSGAYAEEYVVVHPPLNQ